MKTIGCDMTEKLEAYHERIEANYRNDSRYHDERYDAFNKATEELARIRNEIGIEEYWARYDKLAVQSRRRSIATSRLFNMRARAAWDDLKCGDPIVDLIIDNCYKDSEEALDILALFPRSFDEIARYARVRSFCSAFVRYTLLAMRHGLLTIEDVGGIAVYREAALRLLEVEAVLDDGTLVIDQMTIYYAEHQMRGEVVDVRGCSCGEADYGAPGHDGHNES